MRKLVFSFLASLLILESGWAQTLFTYGNSAVTKQEFLRNYQKNTLSRKPDFSEPALKEYLDLYSLFRMKVKEAEVQKLDTIPGIQRELDNYRKQLAKTYLTDEQVTTKLYREAYDRMKEERRVAHILIMAPAGMGAEDTLKIYNRMDSIYQALTRNKADFGELARIYTEDRGSKSKGGDIGFMTALQTLYPFENAVYSTEPGKVSRPFRTSLGFHIVKVVEKRPARGEIQVAQILVSSPSSKGEEGKKAALSRIDSIQTALKKGTSFEDLVRKFSDDRYTVSENGVMPPFGVGRMVPAFEQAAFSLKNIGDVSSPVETEYGFHIIKLLKKNPLKPYDSLHNQIKRQVDNDSRAQMAREIYFEKVKKQNGFKEYPAHLEELAARFGKIPDTGVNANMFMASDFGDMGKTLFSLSKNNYTQSDLAAFAETLTRGKIMGHKTAMIRDIYKMYLDKVVNDFQEHRLVEENEDFRNLMQEYRDGIMLFELMDQNVWGKASRDTTGLKSFYESSKNKYQWEPGFTGYVYHFKNEDALNKGMKLLQGKKPASDEEILEAVNTDAEPDQVTVQQGRYEFSRFKEASRNDLEKGKITRPGKNDDGSYVVIQVTDIFDSNTIKSLDDARGYVIADYQDFLEKKWNDDLRRKYPMKVEEKILKAMVQ